MPRKFWKLPLTSRNLRPMLWVWGCAWWRMTLDWLLTLVSGRDSPAARNSRRTGHSSCKRAQRMLWPNVQKKKKNPCFVLMQSGRAFPTPPSQVLGPGTESPLLRESSDLSLLGSPEVPARGKSGLAKVGQLESLVMAIPPFTHATQVCYRADIKTRISWGGEGSP